MFQPPFRRVVPALLAVVAAATFAALPDQARAQDVQATFTPFGGYTTWSKYVNAKRRPIFGVHAGALLHRRAGIEGTLAFISGRTASGLTPFRNDSTTGPSVKMNQIQYGADVIFNFLSSAFTPYALVGWRHIHFSGSDEEGTQSLDRNGFDAALGAKWDLTPHVGLRGEVRDVMFRFKSPPAPDPPAEQLTHSVYYSAGVQFTLGPGPAPPPPPPPPPAPVTVVVPTPPPPPDTVVVQQPAPPPPPPDTVVSERERELLDTGAITTRDIHFATARWDILPESYPTLEDIGSILTRWPQLRVEIQGHCDSRGSDAYNMRLSQHRAESVLDYLLTHFPKLDRSMFTARGYGERVPVAPNNSLENMARNRRVVFKVLNPEELVKERERRHIEPGTK